MKIMNNNKEPNYKFYSDGVRKVIAVSTFAGKPVRGVAVCAEDDEFDLEFGKKLAKARCDVAVARKRLNRAYDKYDEALEARRAANAHYEDMLDYVWDAKTAEVKYVTALEELLKRE